MKICIYKSQGNWNKSSIFISSLVGIFFSSGSVQNFELTSLKISDHCLIAIFSHTSHGFVLLHKTSYFTKISSFYATKCKFSLYLFKPVLRVLGNALQAPTQSNRKGPLVIHTPACIDTLFPSIFWLLNHPLKLCGILLTTPPTSSLHP